MIASFVLSANFDNNILQIVYKFSENKLLCDLKSYFFVHKFFLKNIKKNIILIFNLYYRKTY